MLSKIPSYIYLILGFISLVISLLITPTADESGFLLLKNIFNAIGSLFIVGGFFEMTFKEKFVKELSTDFTQKLFLQQDSIKHFGQDNLRDMLKNIQIVLSKENSTYQKKLIELMNDHFLSMLQATHKNNEFNSYYEFYDINLNIKDKNEKYIIIDFHLKYKIINIDHEKQVEQSILARRFFPQFKDMSDDFVFQELKELLIIDDGKETNYLKEIKNNQFVEVDIDANSLTDSVNATKNGDTKKQIHFKQNDTAKPKELKVSFKKELVVEKRIQIKTLYTDDIYSHIFKKPILNLNVHYTDLYIDENIENPLELRLFSGLNKTKNDKVRSIYQGDSVSLAIYGDLLLPGEGVMIMSRRKPLE